MAGFFGTVSLLVLAVMDLPAVPVTAAVVTDFFAVMILLLTAFYWVRPVALGLGSRSWLEDNTLHAWTIRGPRALDLDTLTKVSWKQVSGRGSNTIAIMTIKASSGGALTVVHPEQAGLAEASVAWRGITAAIAGQARRDPAVRVSSRAQQALGLSGARDGALRALWSIRMAAGSGFFALAVIGASFVLAVVVAGFTHDLGSVGGTGARG